MSCIRCQLMCAGETLKPIRSGVGIAGCYRPNPVGVGASDVIDHPASETTVGDPAQGSA